MKANSSVAAILTQMNIAAANLAADLATEYLYELGSSAVASFYSDYDPKYYNRSYLLYNTVNRYTSKISAPGVASGGILMSADNIGGYNGTPEQVYDATIMNGIHGFTEQVPTVMNPSPYQLIEKDFESQREMLKQRFANEACAIVKAQLASKLANAVRQEVKSNAR